MSDFLAVLFFFTFIGAVIVGYLVHIKHPKVMEFLNSLQPPKAVDCEMGEWSEWGACTNSCGGGKQTRTRIKKTEASDGGAECEDSSLSEERDCNTQECSADCVMEWNEWGECGGAECEQEGTQSRTYTIVSPAKGGGAECDTSETTRSCQMPACVIDCQVSEWSEWGACGGADCGEQGTRSRTRTVLQQPAGGGAVCPTTLEETESCPMDPCPVDCVVGEWTNVGSCDKECGGGMQQQTRSVITPAQHGGAVCPTLTQSVSCNTQPCPIDCVVSWDAWGTCDKECGGGTQTRGYTITTPAQHGGQECDLSVVSQSCNTQSCPLFPFAHYSADSYMGSESAVTGLTNIAPASSRQGTMYFEPTRSRGVIVPNMQNGLPALHLTSSPWATYFIDTPPLASAPLKKFSLVLLFTGITANWFWPVMGDNMVMGIQFGTTQIDIHFENGKGRTFDFDNSSLMDNQPHLFILSYNDSNPTSEKIKFHVDSHPVMMDGAEGTLSNGMSKMGVNGNGFIGYGNNYKLYEIRLYNDELTSENVTDVKNQLNSKWGTSFT